MPMHGNSPAFTYFTFWDIAYLKFETFLTDFSQLSGELETWKFENSQNWMTLQYKSHMIQPNLLSEIYPIQNLKLLFSWNLVTYLSQLSDELEILNTDQNLVTIQ